MKRIIALILALTLLSGMSAYAVPEELWKEDKRVESLFLTGNTEAKEFDIIQKIIAYLGLADIKDISGEGDVKISVLLTAIAKIAGLEYSAETDIKQIISDLKEAKILRESAKSSLIGFPDIIYAATRITGWKKINSTKENDSTVYTEAKNAGLLRNLQYDAKRSITKCEAAQIIYNILSVNTKEAASYDEKNGNVYISDVKEEAPLLEKKYGIYLKEGITTSVYGESIRSYNDLAEDEIEINDERFKYNSTENVGNLVGRKVDYFIDSKEDYIIFVAPSEKNNIDTIEYSNEPQFSQDKIRIKEDGKWRTVKIDQYAKLVYNGLFAGTYSVSLVENYFGKDSNITLVDNNKDKRVDVVFVRKYCSYPILFNAGAQGTINFDYDLTFEGKKYIDIIPEDRYTHIKVTKNGNPVENLSDIKAGSIVSISATANEVGHKYILIEIGGKQVTGVLTAIQDEEIYCVGDKEYYVSNTLLDLQKTKPGIQKPRTGNEYTFTLDVTGQIVKASVPGGSFAYLVAIESTKKLKATGEIKLFQTDGKMYIYPLAEKVILHDQSYMDGKKYEISDLVERVQGGVEDYRTIVKYRLNDEEKIVELWLPYDNTGGQNGSVNYELTKDEVSSLTRVHYGVYGYKYRLLDTVPIFSIPSSKDAEDKFYLIRNLKYNGNQADIIPLTLYNVDKFNCAEAAVMVLDTEGDNIDKEGALFAVEKVRYTTTADGDSGYEIIGYEAGAKKSYIATDEDLTSSVGSGWPSVKISDVKFGDILQISQISSEIKGFRVLFRASEIGNDRIQYKDGNEATTLDSISGSEPLAMIIGTIDDIRNIAVRVKRNIEGEEYIDNLFLQGGGNIPAYIFNMETRELIKSTPSELHQGDKLVAYKRSAYTEILFAIR